MKPVWKEFWKEIGLAVWLGLVLPASLLGLAVRLEDGRENVAETEPGITAGQIGETQTAAEPMWIDVLLDDTAVPMELEEYLVGVVLGEMPTDFEAEAQKAQAVVARTFTLKCKESGKHEGCAVCTNSACCQAYMAPEEYLSKGGTQEGLERIRDAVHATTGMVLVYEGELIEATYFSCSGGSTEDAVAVWGTDVPYLRATSSPGEEQAAHYSDTVTFSAQDFMTALGLELSGTPENWLGPVTYTAGGGVNTMVVGGTEFKGTQLRQLLDLRSTAFTMTADSESVTVTTRGFGHRVGMSQYGADAMAVNGSGYEQILAHYYRGTTLIPWTADTTG